MVAVLQRHRIIIIVIALMILGLLAWYFLSRQNTSKVPSRGVFVMETLIPQPLLPELVEGIKT